MITKQLIKTATIILTALMLAGLVALPGGAQSGTRSPGPPDPLPVSISCPAAPGGESASALAGRCPRPIITHVLARGSPLHGSNGVYFGPDNLLYIASFISGDILVMNPNSGRILRRITPLPEMNGPDDLTFGPDGALYWTSISTGKVGKLAPDGTQSLVAQLPPGANPITFSQDGRLFVGLDFLGDALYEVYQDGTPPRLIRENLGTHPAAERLLIAS